MPMSSRSMDQMSLEGGVRFVDTLPKNAMGKIMRPKLRALAAAEMATEARLTADALGMHSSIQHLLLPTFPRNESQDTLNYSWGDGSTRPSSIAPSIAPSLATDTESESDADVEDNGTQQHRALTPPDFPPRLTAGRDNSTSEEKVDVSGPFDSAHLKI